MSTTAQEDFTAFYTRMHAFHWSVVHHILGQHEESEETLQEAYLKMWRKWNDAPPGKGRDPWAYTVVRNCALDRWRRLHHTPQSGPNHGYPEHRTVSLEKMEQEFASENERDPEEIIVEQEHEREQHEKLARVIARLPTAYRILLQIYCSDLPYKMVNREGSPSVKMKMRRYRAIKAAKQIVRNDQAC